jgi:L-lactate dehydrogenase
MTPRYRAQSLATFATSLLEACGLEPEKARTVAAILVEGDLMGHTTHGLHLLSPYLADLEAGRMSKTGEPIVVADYPAAVTWDGRRLPGPWLVVRALELAAGRARTQGTCTVVIRRSHHIACLAAYLKPVADQGMMALLTCSDPNMNGVAPHGGRRSLYTPNPLAAAWPTDGEPVVMDVSMSITTNGMAKRLFNEGGRFPGLWAVDGDGNPSDNPAVLFGKNPGGLLPMGGLDHGHKGYALGLLIEALTGGLAGHGRADPPEGWSANVLVQVLDPALFGSREDFTRQTSWIAEACRSSEPRAGFDRVRMPGESGIRRRAESLAQGVELYPGIMEALAPWADKLGIPVPSG